MSVVIFRARKALPVLPSVEKIVSKKDEAFELFSQGKTPDDPEVKALGLKPESAKKYFRLWKQQH